MEEIILETKELCKQYHKQTVLKNINMRIPKGCVYGLLGANGAGKSTLMKILCGMTRADAGEVFVDLKNTGKKQVGKFSMGMKQRLGIAVALLNDPDFLILDEPANGLDPFGIRQLREMLVSFAESGMTVLVSSHILGEIQQTADYIGILANGVLGYQGGQQENLEELFTEIVSRNRG